MLRIDQRKEGETVLILAAGCVAGPWVEELRRVIESSLPLAGDVAIDLEAVTYVDRAGEELLREAIGSGVRIRAQSGFVAALLEASVAEGARGSPPYAGATPVASDRELIEAILSGSEDAFLSLARRCHAPMLDLARCFSQDEATANEVVGFAWRDVLEQLGSWDGSRSLERSAVCAAARRSRSSDANDRPRSTRARDAANGPLERAVGAADAWHPADLERAGALEAVRSAIDGLPAYERAVMTMRDVAGCGAEETSDALGIAPSEQRALLHRARSSVHAALDEHFWPGDDEAGRRAGA
jgi:RNA polymerase sigma-70 factor (ECF subfamily)